MTSTCSLCGELAGGAAILDHLRVMHPEQYGDGPEHWPDGSAVVFDETLEPIEFGGDAL